MEIEDWDAGRVDIKWTPPESDGGAPITSYIVEYKDKFSGEWTSGPVRLHKFISSIVFSSFSGKRFTEVSIESA